MKGRWCLEMNYFDYSKSHSASRVVEVYEAVQDLKGYAISIYKGLWEDALDKSFFHILENFDEESGGDLTHYATRVVGTILLNKYNKEIENETALSSSLDSQSIKDIDTNPVNILINMEERSVESVSTDVEECMEYLLPRFIVDYRFFKTKKASNRKLSYKGLFGKFSERTVLEAMSNLEELYSEPMDELNQISKESHFRNFTGDRYKKSLDTSIEVKSMIGGILLYEKNTSRSSKKFFSADLEDFIDGLVHVLYKSGKYSRKVGKYTAYCSLSGSLFTDEGELRKCLEREIIGCILARQPVKVVMYKQGKYIVLSASKCIDSANINVFDVSFTLEFKPLIAKCVNK